MNRSPTRTAFTWLTSLLAAFALIGSSSCGGGDDTLAEADSEVGETADDATTTASSETTADDDDADSAGDDDLDSDDMDDDSASGSDDGDDDFGGDNSGGEDSDDDSDDDGGEGADVVVEATVADGEVSVAQTRFPVAVGSSVLISVEADVAEEVHVHGYDLHADVAPGEPASVEFVADVPGLFEVELEGSHLLLFEIEVS